LNIISVIFGILIWSLIIYRWSTEKPKANTHHLHHRGILNLPGDFKTAVIVLCAAMMKKESRSRADEYAFFRNYFEQQFRQKLSSEAVAMLREASYIPLHLSRICVHLSRKISYEERIHLMHFLYGFALSDQYVTDAEIRLIRLAGRFMFVTEKDLNSLYAFYFIDGSRRSKSSSAEQILACYKILGVSPEAGHDEIRKAYRVLAMKHHPDKVAHLGEEFQHQAKETFQTIVDAYKKIRKVRGF
jgi:DnaJ like chaperone protein